MFNNTFHRRTRRFDFNAVGFLVFGYENVTHESCSHVESSVLGVDDGHVAEGDVKAISKNGNLELGLELGLVEAGKCRPGVGRLEVGRSQVPVTVEEAFTHIRRLISMST